MPAQVATRLSALSAACKALEEARKGGKAREARADKALAKLEKAERPDLALPGGATQAPAQTPGTAAPPVWALLLKLQLPFLQPHHCSVHLPWMRLLCRYAGAPMQGE